MNAKDLNSYCDSYVGVTKVKIRVARVMHFYLCLLGYANCLLAYWSRYYMLLGVGGLLRCVPFNYNLGVNTCS
jgi:hypothetical protein